MAIICASISSWSQELTLELESKDLPTIKLSRVLRNLMDYDLENDHYKSYIVQNDLPSNCQDFFKKEFPYRVKEDGYVSCKMPSFRSCILKDIEIDHIRTNESPSIIFCSGSISISDCIINPNLFILSNELQRLKIERCSIDKINMVGEIYNGLAANRTAQRSFYTDVDISNNKLHKLELNSGVKAELITIMSNQFTSEDSLQLQIDHNIDSIKPLPSAMKLDLTAQKVFLRDNHLPFGETSIYSESEIFFLSNNTIGSLLIAGTFDYLGFNSNKVDAISIDSNLDESRFESNGTEFRDNIIASFNNRYHGIYSPILVDNPNENFRISRLLKFLYDHFRSVGSLTKANDFYYKLKELQTKTMRIEYRNTGDRKIYFNIKLNELLRLYTDYGTNPSKAIIISFQIILLFSVIFFLFPSDWDTKSKKKLIADFKTFIKRNEHGYTKPFLKLILGFMISLFNAVTLSLNSFITLGFGNIPTHGLAKYACIVEGVIGWFLLSIFSVSLINQLLI